MLIISRMPPAEQIYKVWFTNQKKKNDTIEPKGGKTRGKNEKAGERESTKQGVVVVYPHTYC